MGPSLPASILLRTQLEEAKKERDGAKPLLDKIQAAEKRLRTCQKAVEAASDDGSRRQSSWTSVAADLPLAATTPARSQEVISSNLGSPCALRWRSSGSGWPRRRRRQPWLLQRHGH